MKDFNSSMQNPPKIIHIYRSYKLDYKIQLDNYPSNIITVCMQKKILILFYIFKNSGRLLCLIIYDLFIVSIRKTKYIISIFFDQKK